MGAEECERFSVHRNGRKADIHLRAFLGVHHHQEIGPYLGSEPLARTRSTERCLLT